MKWEVFDYNNYHFKDNTSYVLFIDNIRLGKGEYSYGHVHCYKNNIIHAVDSEWEWNFKYDEHRILYYYELANPLKFLGDIRKDKISKLLELDE